MPLKLSVVVSYEFTSFVGHGMCDRAMIPPTSLIFAFGDIGEPCIRVLTTEDIATGLEDDMVVFAISRAAWARLFGEEPKPGGSWYLPADLRALGRAIVAVDGDTERETMLRSARSIELICALATSFREARMAEVRRATTLSGKDISLVAAAHQMISEHFGDKLTLGEIARRCGLNRLKLSSGFRELYDCTVADAMADRRLEKARELLAQSELSIATIGYRCGYTNPSSFSRAFTRWHGVSPSEFKKCEQNCATASRHTNVVGVAA